MNTKDIKATATSIYNALLFMIDLVANKYSSLANEADREEYRKFVHFKQEVITKTNTLVGMLASTSSALQMIAQDFIFAVYELHQFLIQLVIDNTRPSKEKVLEIRAGLNIVHHTGIALSQALESPLQEIAQPATIVV